MIIPGFGSPRHVSIRCCVRCTGSEQNRAGSVTYTDSGRGRCVSDVPAGWTGRRSWPAEKRSDRRRQDMENWERTAASEKRERKEEELSISGWTHCPGRACSTGT